MRAIPVVLITNSKESSKISSVINVDFENNKVSFGCDPKWMTAKPLRNDETDPEKILKEFCTRWHNFAKGTEDEMYSELLLIMLKVKVK